MTDRRIVPAGECIEAVIALLLKRWPWLTRETLLDTANREKPFTYARWVAWRLMMNCGVSAHVIGRRLGMDHTSVLYALRSLPKLVAENPDFGAEIDALDAEVNVTILAPQGTRAPVNASRNAVSLLLAPAPEGVSS